MDFRYELSIKLWQIPPRTCLCHQNSIFSLKVKSAFTNLCIKYRVLRSCVGSEVLPLHYFFNLLCFGLVVSKSTCELNTLFFSLSFAMIKQPKYGILSMENTSTMPFFWGGGSIIHSRSWCQFYFWQKQYSTCQECKKPNDAD